MPTPKAPKDLIIKRSGPPEPPLQASNNAIPLLTNTNNNIVKNGKNVQNQVQLDVTQEAQDLQRTHNQLVNTLDPTSEFAQIGKVLSEALDRLTPQGTAIFAPIVQDFSDQVLSSLTSDPADTPEISDSFTSDISSLINYLTQEESQQIIAGLQTALLIKAQRAQAQQSQEGKVRHDALNGYQSTINALVNCSELIATYGPRSWSDLSKRPEVATAGLSEILLEASNQVYSSYAEASANAIAIHGIVRSSSLKSKKISNSLKTTSAILSAVSVGISAFKNSQGTLADTKAIQNLMKQAAISAIQKGVNQVLTQVEKKLFGSGIAPNMSSKVK